MAKRLNVALNFTANTSQVKNQIQELSNLLNQIAYGSNIKVNTASLKEAQTAAKELAYHLNKAYNPESGKIDLSSFNKSLKDSGSSVTKLSQSLLSAGSTGQQAFVSLARSISQAEQPIIRVNGLLTEMWTTMKNTARWQITSSVLHGFIGSLQQAVGYAKDLNKTLTDIRIVAPEKSMEDMYKFAALANKQAKELSSTTLDYAKGALIYYQQGLDDALTKERTDVTTKMANVTGDSVDEVSSYMTSIWNNFNKAGDESAEHFADILTKLGAETAASTTEITAALEKYTGVASTIGLSYESATAAATTLIDRLREQPEVAGTALKTIFARLEGLKLEGSTDEGGLTTDLNKYSKALHQIGVEIKDANGDIRQADEILMAIGEKWNSGDLTQDVKIATAQTVAGIRQWQQFAALMENFEYFKKYKDMATTGSEGALQEQQEIYAESWEAAANRVKSSIQSIYMDLLNDKAFIKILNVIADLTNGLDGFIDKIGGLKGVLLAVGSFALMGLRTKIQPAIQTLAQNIQILTGKAQSQYDKTYEQMSTNIAKAKSSGKYNDYQLQELTNSEQLLALKSKLSIVNKSLTESERAQAEMTIAGIEKQQQELLDLIKLEEELQQKHEKNTQASNLKISTKDIDSYAAKIRKQRSEGSATDIGDNAFNAAVARESSIQAILAKKSEQLKNKKATTSIRGKEVYEAQIDSLNNDFEKINSKTSAAGLNKIHDSVLQMTESLPAMTKEMVSFQKQIDKLNTAKAKGDTEAYKEALAELIAIMEKTKINGKDFEKFLNQSGTDGKKAIDAEINSYKELNEVQEKVIQGQNELNGQVKDFQPEHMVSGIEAVSAAAAALGQAAMVIFSLKSLLDTLNDPDISGMEKFATIAMSISMLIPALIGSFSGFKTSISKLGTAFAESAGASITFRGSVIATAGAEEVATGATKTLGEALKGLFANPYLWIILAITAAIVALGIAIKKSYDEAHKAEKHLKEVSEATKTARENYNNLNSEIENVNSTLDSWKNQKEALNDLTYGTKDWTDALKKANTEAKNVIDSFNEANDVLEEEITLNKLNQKAKEEGYGESSTIDLEAGKDYFKNQYGELEITLEGQWKIDTINEMAVAQASINVNAAEMNENKAETAAAIEHLANNYGSEFGRNNAGYTWGPNGATPYSQSTEGKEQVKNIVDQVYSAMRQDENFTFEDLEKGNWLANNTNLDADTIKEIQGNEDFLNDIYDVLVSMKESQNENIELAKKDIENNSKIQDALYGPNSPLTKEEKELYGANTEQQIASDTAVLAKQWSEDPAIIKQLQRSITGTRGQDGLKAWYAKENDYEYDREEDKFYKKNAEGEREEQAVTEDEINYALAYNAALEDRTNLIDEYNKLIKDSVNDWDSLKKVADSDAWKNFNDRIEEMGKDFDKSDKELHQFAKKLATDYKDDIAEFLDIDPEKADGIFNEDFIADHAELFQKAIDGDKEALEDLQRAAAQELVLDMKTDGSVDELLEAVSKDENSVKFQLGIDENSIQSDLDAINEYLQSQKFDDIEVGTEINDEGFLNGINHLMSLGEAGAAQAQKVMDAAAVEPEIGYKVVRLDDGSDAKSLKTVRSRSSGHAELPTMSDDGVIEVTQADYESFMDNKIDAYGKDFGNNYTIIPYVKSMKKKANNVQPTIPGSTQKNGTGGNGGNGGGGGGGRRGSRRTRVERARKGYEKSTVLKRYKEITDRLDENSKASDRLAKVQDKLYGKSRLNAMDQVNKKHLDEISLLKTKAKEANNYYKQDKAEMEKRLKEALSIVKNGAGFSSKYLTSSTMNAIKNITGFTYGDFGNITNYTQIMSALQDELNELENMYNNFKGTKENQDKFKEEKITPVAEAISRLQEAIDQYDETRELIEELKDKIEDAYAQWQDTNYEKLTYSLELQITVNDNELKYIENKLNAVSDNIYKAAESLDYYFSTTGENKLSNATRAIKDYTNHITELTNAYQNNTITQAKYVEGLQSSYDALLSNIDTLQDLKKEMMDYYGKTLNSVIDQLDKTNDRLSASSSLISHLQNILGLTGQNTNYDLIENLQNAQMMVDTTNLNTAKAIYDLTASENEKKQKAYLEARTKSLAMLAAGGPEELRQKEIEELQDIIAKGGSSDDIAKASERLKVLQAMTDEAYKNLIEDNEEMAKKEAEAAVEAFENARDTMFSSTEEALQHAADALETALNRAADAMEKALSRMVGGFDELLRRMNLTSTRQDEYLTKTNQEYELNKMQRTLAKDMDATDNKNSKIKLANFAKELQALAERDELSNLELEIAQKKYELLKAQIALEDSRNAKSTIRLSRDNEGNYGYVYVADEQEVEDAQQAVEDAKHDLYNLQLEATNNYGQKYIQATQEYQNALKDFYASDEYKELLGTGNQTAIDERIAALQNQYAALINSYGYLYQTGYGATDWLVDALKNDAWVYSGYNDYVTNIGQNLGGVTTGFISDMTGAGSVFSTWLTNIQKYANVSEQMANIVPETEKNMNQLAEDFEITGERLVIVLDQVSDKLQKFIESTLPELDKSIVDTTAVVNSLKEILKDAAEGNIDQPTKNFNKMMQLVAGSNAGNLQYDSSTHVAYTTNGTYGVNASQAKSWSLDTIAKNEVIAEQLIDLITSGRTGFFGFDKNGNLAYITGVTTSDTEYKNWVSSEGILKAVKFDTGGYTGEWVGTKAGRLAILDEKEIVLNEQDTNNILQAVSAVRGLAASGFLSALTPATVGFENMKSSLVDQNVKIEAQFPNVSDRYEIEEAFNNLVNRAAQHAYTNHK